MDFLKNDLKALIVEDNPVFRQIFTDSLHTRFPSMIIQEAAEGSDAMQKVNTFHPNLIFMDVHLPGENGFQLTKKIKTTYPDIAIVILTDYDVPEFREAAFQLSASCFIPKDSLNLAQIETLVKSL